ncbi:MAG: acyltransferase [Anaerolineales bacterium]|nr:acyltransferase [Anaerolineales bacterium]
MLAMLVMCQHLLNLAPLGQYAVFCFYVISGYLMTLIMHETYGYSWRGRYYFAINRVLRLYPIYWLIIGFTALLILYIGEDITRNYNPSLYLPNSPAELLQNISLVFASWNPITVFPRFVPPAWALTVELFFYFLICLGISKTLNRVRFWFFASLIYIAITYALGLDDDSRYSPILAGSLPFSIGAWIYFYSKKGVISKSFSRIKLSARWLFVLLVANCILGLGLYYYLPDFYIFHELAFYTNLIIGSLLVYKIVTGDQILKLSEKIDKFIGDFSYPIYLSHWQVGLLVSFSLFGKPIHTLSRRGVESFLLSIIVVFMLSYLLIVLIDKPIQRIRAKFKD